MALYVLLQQLPLPDQFINNWLPLISWALVSAAIALRSYVTARNATTATTRRAWGYMTAAAAIWCLGIIYESVGFALIEGFEFSGWTARILYFAYPVFFTVGLSILTFTGPRTLGRVHLANLGVIGFSMLICTLLVLMEPVLSSGKSTLYIAFSVVDLAVFSTATIVALIYLWSAQTNRLRFVVTLLGLGAAIHAAVNISFYYRSLEFGEVGPILDVFWIWALLFQYWAAFEQDNISAASHGQDEVATRRSLSRFANAIQVALPAALILGMLALMAVFYENLTSTLLQVILPLAVLFAVCLGLREWAMEIHREHLTRDLQRLHSLNSHVLRVSPGVIFVCKATPGFPVTYVSENVRSLFGIELPDVDMARHIHPEDRTSVIQMLHQTLTHGSSSGEIRIKNVDGDLRWIDQRLVLRHDAHGNAIEIVGTALDITERKVLQRSVEQNQRLESLGQLSGSIAHDFNNLLTTILGFAGLVLGSGKLAPKERDGVAEIQAAGERGAALTSQLLSFSRRHAFAVEVVDLNRLVEEMHGMLERLLGDSANLVFRASPLPVRVKGSKNQLEQVLMNLVLNAKEAMPDGGTIQVSISEVFREDEQSDRDPNAGRFAILCVEDEGPGVDEDMQSKIFDPFYTTKKEGTGLGLATAHSIVRQHRGSIDVSNRPGGGALFKVSVPSTSEQADAKTYSSAELIQHGTERILIIDDEAAITHVIASILQPLGYTVFTANNAEQAESIAAAEALDLILSDIVMPDCNGRELTRRLRQIRPDVKVIYMSGYTNDVLAQRQVWDGDTPLLQKPLKLSHMAAVIRQTLDTGAIVREVEGPHLYL